MGHGAHQSADARHARQDQPGHIRHQCTATGPRQAVGGDVVDVVDDEGEVDQALQPMARGIGVLKRISVYIGVPIEPTSGLASQWSFELGYRVAGHQLTNHSDVGVGQRTLQSCERDTKFLGNNQSLQLMQLVQDRLIRFRHPSKTG